MARTTNPPPAQRRAVVPQGARAGRVAATPAATTMRYTASRWVWIASTKRRTPSETSRSGMRRVQMHATRTASGTQ